MNKDVKRLEAENALMRAKIERVRWVLLACSSNLSRLPDDIAVELMAAKNVLSMDLFDKEVMLVDVRGVSCEQYVLEDYKFHKVVANGGFESETWKCEADAPEQAEEFGLDCYKSENALLRAMVRAAHSVLKDCLWKFCKEMPEDVEVELDTVETLLDMFSFRWTMESFRSSGLSCEDYVEKKLKDRRAAVIRGNRIRKKDREDLEAEKTVPELTEEQKTEAEATAMELLEATASVLVQKIQIVKPVLDDLFSSIHIGTEKESAAYASTVRALLDLEDIEYAVDTMQCKGITAEEYVRGRLADWQEVLQ